MSEKKDNDKRQTDNKTLSLGIEKIIDLPVPKNGGCGNSCIVINNTQ